MAGTFTKTIATGLFGLMFTTSAWAMEPPAADTPAVEDVQKLMKMLEEQNEVLARQEEELKTQKERVKFLSSQVNNLLNAKTMSELAPAAGGVPEESKSAEAKKEVGIERKPEERDRPPTIEAVGNQGGVLLRPGQAVLESALEYSRSSALRVAIEGFTIIPALNIGAFEISQVDRDTVVSSVSGRLGVFNNFEVEAKIPYVMRSDSTLSRPIGTGSSANTLSDVTGENLGDIEIAGRYQIMNAGGGWPFLIGNLRLKSRTGVDPFEVPIDPGTGLQTELPTGSGFFAVQPSITAIMPSDPVVLYATMGYLYNMSRDIGGAVGEIDPGDSISASFGMGFSLNEQTSFSLGYAHDYVFKTEQNGLPIPNSDELHVGRMLLGFGYRVTDETSINLNVDAGLTDDAPDARVMIRVPMRFDLF